MGGERNNILPLIGVEKPQKVKVRKVIDKNFRITDMIEMAKKKTEKRHASTTKHTISNLKYKTHRAYDKTNVKLSPRNYNMSLSKDKSIESGIKQRLEDPFWKKNVKSPNKPFIEHSYILKSSQHSPSKRRIF